MTSTKHEQTPETDADRAAKVVNGRTQQPATRKRQQSRATRSSVKNSANAKPSTPKPADKPAKSEPTKTDLQKLVFAELFRAAGAIVDSPPTGVTMAQASKILSQRMRYTPR